MFYAHSHANEMKCVRVLCERAPTAMMTITEPTIPPEIYNNNNYNEIISALQPNGATHRNGITHAAQNMDQDLHSNSVIEANLWW